MPAPRITSGGHGWTERLGSLTSGTKVAAPRAQLARQRHLTGERESETWAESLHGRHAGQDAQTVPLDSVEGGSRAVEGLQCGLADRLGDLLPRAGDVERRSQSQHPVERLAQRVGLALGLHAQSVLPGDGRLVGEALHDGQQLVGWAVR